MATTKLSDEALLEVWKEFKANLKDQRNAVFPGSSGAETLNHKLEFLFCELDFAVAKLGEVELKLDRAEDILDKVPGKLQPLSRFAKFRSFSCRWRWSKCFTRNLFSRWRK